MSFCIGCGGSGSHLNTIRPLTFRKCSLCDGMGVEHRLIGAQNIMIPKSQLQKKSTNRC